LHPSHGRILGSRHRQGGHDDLITTAPVHVRHATLYDADGIGETHAESWLAAYRHIFDAGFLARSADSRRHGWGRSLSALLVPPNFVLVAEVDGRIVGFASARPSDRGSSVGEVSGFYAHPDVWGSGAARDLMSETCAILAADYTDVVVWTLRDAPQARRFYEKAGFRVTGEEKMDPLTDWSTGERVERPAVEYLKRFE
jgi:ribosomal protein S18 acetylase RimI-like enzyme